MTHRKKKTFPVRLLYNAAVAVPESMGIIFVFVSFFLRQITRHEKSCSFKIGEEPFEIFPNQKSLKGKHKALHIDIFQSFYLHLGHFLE